MLGIELLKINRKSVEMMSKSGIRMDDHKFVPMYEKYQEMRSNGDKVSYIVAMLAEAYKVSESSVKRIIRRLSSEVIF